MEPPTSAAEDEPWSGRCIDFEAFGRDIERRRTESGITDMPRNRGNRRTESKRALLEAIAAAGGKW